MVWRKSLGSLIKSEDWWACWFGLFLFAISSVEIIPKVHKPKIWLLNPLEAFSMDVVQSFFFLITLLAIVFMVGLKLMGEKSLPFLPAFVMLSCLGLLAQVISQQSMLDSYGLEYVLWALILGLAISNTVGLPEFIQPAVRTELYIKTGLVLLGAEILISRILNLGIQGLLLAWGVTPIVLYVMYKYGTSILRIDKTLTILIAAATSVCGVSAAIAVAAATKARKEYLTFTISLSLLSTAIMLIVLPTLIKAIGIDYLVGGAWIGGTVDSTGAVVAAGELLSQEAMEIAAVVKLIQNIMIGIIAFIIALLWVTTIDSKKNIKPRPIEIWYRFPKFIIAFMALSLMSSFILTPILGEVKVTRILVITGGMRTFLFAVAFLSIGLETDFKNLRKQVLGGRPVQLYVLGQAFNVILTFAAAWLLFS